MQDGSVGKEGRRKGNGERRNKVSEEEKKGRAQVEKHTRWRTRNVDKNSKCEKKKVHYLKEKFKETD